MKIKNIECGNVILAPMAGVNCTAFRMMCKKYGCSLLFTQMYEVDTIIEKNKSGKIADFLNIKKQEMPIVIQLIGNEKSDWKNAIKIVEKHCDLIDINLGCAEKEYLDKKMGSWLLQYPDKIKKIANMCVSVATNPITAKIRAGFDSENAVETAKLLEQKGISAITLHPRLAIQKYGGKADWQLIKKIKQAVSIPIIGNGDITLPGHAKALVEQTKCDAVMVGRAAMRDPEIFRRVNYIIENGKNMPEREKDGKKLIKEFLKLYLKFENRKSLNEIKDHALWFLSSTKGAPQNKKLIQEAKSIDEIMQFAKII